MRVPFATNSYQARALPLSAQRCVNLYAEAAPPDAKSPLVLFGTPGLTTFATCGDGPIRGVHNFNGVLCVVSGTNLYTVDSAGTVTDRGSVGATADVSMDHNLTQLLIITGTGITDAWIWNGTTLTQMADADFPGAHNTTFIDGYHIVTKPNTDEFYISDSRDCTSWDALQFATAEGKTDYLVACMADHRELWLFGSETTEVWYNSGDTVPFDRISGAYLERGCLSKGSIAKADNSMFWLGDDKIIYRADGYTPLRISTHAIEYALASAADLTTSRAWTYTQEGHTFYVITIDGVGTFVYDASIGLWHERDSRDSLGRTIDRWRIDTGVKCYDKILGGDYTNGIIYELDLDVYTENGIYLQRLATSAPIHGEGQFISMSKLEIEVESGAGLTTGQGSDPQAMLRWSDDGGKTWSNELWSTMGALGDYSRRIIFNRLGRFRSRIYELTISDPIKVAIIAANAAVS
ncbi:MAG: hypothetical protein H8E94_03040 [Alphaproteobacteria bacterium]|nr:hypothetical protein [Alphaproteobacteria bacterium]